MDTAEQTYEEWRAEFGKQADAEAEVEKQKSWLQKAGEFAQKTDTAERLFYENLPRNVTVGVLNAGIAMAKSVNWLDHLLATPADQAYERVTNPAAKPDAQGKVPLPGFIPDESIGAVEKFRDWAASLGEQQPVADSLVQTGTQFALPFAFYSRAFGVARGAGFLANLGRVTAAEAATGLTGMEPDSARMADLVKMGRDSETRFGDFLRSAAPDDGLVNHYLNWMTSDRENESETEARFKNAIDNTVGAGVVNGLIKTAAGTFKASRGLLGAAAGELGGGGPVGPGAQQGMMNFHGSRHDFAPTPDNPLGEFDLSKVGAGEGAQTRGHGIYLAEAKPVAQGYTRAGMNTPVLVGGQPATAVAKTPAERAVADRLALYMRAGSELPGAQKMTERWLRNESQWARMGSNQGELDKGLAFLRKTEPAPAGNLYHVDIPDEQVAKMLDWDKPLAGQKLPPAVEDLRKHLVDTTQAEYGGDQLASPSATGADLYRVLADRYSPEAASRMLAERGVPGLRFLDLQSRGAGKGTRNMVLFDTKIAKIVHKESGK